MAKSKNETATVDLIINGQSANAKLRDLEAAARKVKSELRGMMPGSAEFKKTAENLSRLENQLQKTRVEAGLTASKWQKMKQEIKTTFIGNLGANMATLGLQKIATYFTDAWENAKKLSDQMADIGRTTGLSAQEVKNLNSELSKINTRTSMEDLRNMAIVAGQFGVARSEIVGFVQAIDQVNIVMGGEFGGNAEAVATEMSKLRNIFTDIKSENIGNDIEFISNAINKLAQEGVATAPVVSDLANRIGGYGIQVGLTTGQVLGLSATLQELNVSSERGGTAVIKIIQKMLTNVETFADIAGMPIKEFESLLNTDLFGAFKKVMEGSQKMGGSSTLLAGVIKELEVQGAGASEVFAKLGSNMEMLEGKVNLSSNALTNNNSISEQAKIKQEDFAGAVDKLSKSWNKLTTNPAIVGFFSIIVSGTEKVVTLLDKMVQNWGVTIDFIFKGRAAAVENLNQKILAKEREHTAALEAETQKKVAGFKNGLLQMQLADVEHTKKTLEIAYNNEIARAKQLNAQGKTKEAAIIIAMAKEKSLEIKATDEVLVVKRQANNKVLNERKKLTDEMVKEQQKQARIEAEIAEKSAKEKLSYEEARTRYELEQFQKKMYQEIEGMKELAALEAELGGDELDNEIERLSALQEKWDKTLSEMTEASDEKKQKSTEDFMDGISQLANETQNVLGEFSNLLYRIDQNELARDRKSNQIKKQNLEDRFNKGLISKEQYDNEVLKIENESEQRQAEINKKTAKREKNMAVFQATIKAALAWVMAVLNPALIPQAVAATAAAGIVAATPLPEFEQGGFTGSGLDQTYNNKKIAGVVHPNEFVINATQLRNPYVYNFAKDLAVNKTADGLAPGLSSNANGNNVTVNNNAKLEALLEKLLAEGVKGVWDWDYYQRTSKRMSLLERRIKL